MAGKIHETTNPVPFSDLDGKFQIWMKWMTIHNITRLWRVIDTNLTFDKCNLVVQ